jgi:2-polyprenyl-6-methoxyphenol hydroxylase-like FAD-dependent oxidoreductase
MKTEDLYLFEPLATRKPALNWRSKVQSLTDPGLANPRVWLMGDAMHVMLPNRGMGGNQAMLDTTVILPLLHRLARFAEMNGEIPKNVIAVACKEYECEMIPRTFKWVEASGGLNPVVSAIVSSSITMY